MNILSLRYFIAVAECGSFTRASESLYTTQPNISKHIKQLESELQAPLFLRSGKNSRLTGLGEFILADVKQIVTTVDQLQNKAYGYNLGEYGQLAIGYTADLNPHYIATIMSSFCSLHPNIKISFARRTLESELLDALYNDELDAIITSALDSPDDEKICCRVISLNEMVLVVPKEHRFCHFNVVKMEDLIGESMILFPRPMSPTFHDWILKYIPIKHKNTMSTIIDACTKELLAWVLSESLEIDFVLETVHQLIENYGVSMTAETLINSDQGVHYTSIKFIQLIKDSELRQSMSRKANCWDNAPQESFYGHMKDEIDISECITYEEIHQVIRRLD